MKRHRRARTGRGPARARAQGGGIESLAPRQRWQKQPGGVEDGGSRSGAAGADGDANAADRSANARPVIVVGRFRIAGIRGRQAPFRPGPGDRVRAVLLPLRLTAAPSMGGYTGCAAIWPPVSERSCFGVSRAGVMGQPEGSLGGECVIPPTPRRRPWRQKSVVLGRRAKSAWTARE